MRNRRFCRKQIGTQILQDGLSKLEYRGCDSVGINIRDGEKEAEAIKEKLNRRYLLK